MIKPGRLDDPYWLVFPHYDVKNRARPPVQSWYRSLRDHRRIHPRLSVSSAERIERALALPGRNGRGEDITDLEPGHDHGSDRESGPAYEITVHQFRHAAAAIFLKEHPGEYETIRQLLGHRNIQTTMNFYVGLNTIQANELFQRDHKKAVGRKTRGS